MGCSTRCQKQELYRNNMKLLNFTILGATDTEDSESMTLLMGLEDAQKFVNQSDLWYRIVCKDKELKAKLLSLSPTSPLISDFLQMNSGRLQFEVYPAEVFSSLSGKVKIEVEEDGQTNL